MSNALIWLLCSICFCLDIHALTNKNNEVGSSLELVHVLFRHGDRTPDKTALYPKDPHINATYHPVGLGQLTNAGKRKEYLLGKALYKRYGRFLGNYNIDTVDARCTNYNRTKMSLQLVLASLFPPKDDLVWEKRLNWQPVPFNYWSLQEDHVLGDEFKNCPKYRKLYEQFYSSEEGQKLFENFTAVTNYIGDNAGHNMTSKRMADMYFTLTTEHEHGLKLPNWTSSVFPHTIKDLAILDYVVSTGTPELKRLSSGFLMKKIIHDSRQKMQKTLPQNTKMFLYSAHETNLAQFLRYLGVFYPHVPPYGSYILLEIHNLNGVRGVKVFYQDYTAIKPRRLRVPNCENFCRFERFVSLYKELLPEKEEECLA